MVFIAAERNAGYPRARRSGLRRGGSVEGAHSGQLTGGPRFVGRDAELATLAGALADAVAGRGGGLVLVSGEPGIGKTTLATTFAAQARGQGAQVAWGGAWEEGGAPPYWPWVQVLRSLERDVGAAALAEAAGPGAGLLAQLVPSLGTPPGASADGAGARVALFDAVTAALDRAARAAPLVVLLDDLHAAGRASALLLRFAFEARLARVLLIALYRDVEARLDDELSEVVGALEASATLITLGGLSREEIGILLPGAGPGVLTAVERRSEGNPLFIAQVARMPGSGPGAVADADVPAGIRQAIRRQITQLTQAATVSGTGDGKRPTAEEVLTTAAVLAGDLDPGLVAQVLGAPAESVSGVFDRAARTGLLRASSAPPQAYAFAHALIREALYGELSPRGRAEAHRSVAAVLEQPPWRGQASNAELAHHYLRAMPAGTGAGEGSGIALRAAQYAGLAGRDALGALAYEEAAAHFGRAVEALSRAAEVPPASRCELLLGLAEALLNSGATDRAEPYLREALRLARQSGTARQLAAAALLSAAHLDFNAPDDSAVALLREAADALGSDAPALRARTLARLAVALGGDPDAARAAAGQAVQLARQSGDPGALAAALGARQHVLWGTQDPAGALAGATEIVAAARMAGDPERELDGHVLRLTHLLETCDGPAARRELAQVERLAGLLRQPLARLVACSRRSTLAALDGDFPLAARQARLAWDIGTRASLPDAGAVLWGQLFAVWLETRLPDGDEDLMEQILRGLVARSHLSTAHAAALVLIDAEHGAWEQARGRFGELATAGVATMRPGMLYVWALALLARGCCVLGLRQHATPLYQALLPFAGRAAVGAGAVMCAGSVDRYLGGLAALSGQTAAAEEHFEAAIAHHRRLGARPLLARTLHEYAQLLTARAAGSDHARAAEALAEARAIAAECGMTRLAAILNQQQATTAGAVMLEREGGYWAVRHAGRVARLPDSLGLRYLDLLIRNPGRELAALDIIQLASTAPASTGPASTAPASTVAAGAAQPGLARHPGTTAAADDVLDARALAEYRRRLAELDDDLAEAERWNDTERASRARAERDFLLTELALATGIHGRPRRLASEAERARVNVTRAIRSAIGKIRTHDPDAAAHLDQAVRTGTYCSYTARR
jgi:tetratricopeptide (TPR) repeat protein